MKHREIYNSAQLMEAIQEMGFLPLLDSGIRGPSPQCLRQADLKTHQINRNHPL